MMSTPLEKAFDQAVPKLQACNRGYAFVFNTPLNERAKELKFSKLLQDGRTIYVYLDSGCKVSEEKFENYLKQIDSY
jgi:hypothetical protein